MMGVFRNSSSLSELAESNGVPTAGSLRKVLKSFQSGHASVAELLNEMGGISAVVDEDLLNKVHTTLSSMEHLEGLIGELVKRRDPSETKRIGDGLEQRQYFIRQWVASTVIANGPESYRKNILHGDGLLESILAYFAGGHCEEPQTGMITKVISALHVENDGKVASVFIHNRDCMEGLLNQIHCNTVSHFIPKLILDMRTSIFYPFDYKVVHKRSAYALLQANVYELLSARFAAVARKPHYSLDDIKILENISYVVGEVAGRISILPQVEESKIGSLFAESARLFAKARVGLDIYRRPITVEKLVAAGLVEIRKRQGRERFIAMESAVRCLLIILKKYEKGLECRFDIVQALTKTKLDAFLNFLSSYLGDFAKFLKDKSPEASLLRFYSADLLSTCFCLMKKLRINIIALDVHKSLIELASSNSGCFYKQLAMKCFNVGMMSSDIAVQKAWLSNRSLIRQIHESVSEEGEVSGGDKGTGSEALANMRIAAVALKKFVHKVNATKDAESVKEMLGQELYNDVNSIDEAKLEGLLNAPLPVLVNGKHPKSAIAAGNQEDMADGISEIDRESMFYYSAIKNAQELRSSGNGDVRSGDIFENVLGGLRIGQAGLTESGDITRENSEGDGAEFTSQRSSGEYQRTRRSVDGFVRRGGRAMSMSRSGSESNRSMEAHSGRPARFPLTMSRAGSESNKSRFHGSRDRSTVSGMGSDRDRVSKPKGSFFRGLRPPLPHTTSEVK